MNPKRLYPWVKRISKEWTGTTRHFKAAVVDFSPGVVKAGSGQIRRIAGHTRGKRQSQRRRLQRFVSRPQPLGTFFRVWTRSVLRTIRPKQVVLLIDETKLKADWGVMVVGLAFGRRCIPLAWAVYRANDREAYPVQGQVQLILDLLRHVQAGIPRGVKVRVLADRGIGTSPALMRGVMALGWYFLFRVTKQSKLVLPEGTEVTFHEQVTHPGDYYAASGTVFKKRGHIPAHVRVLWHPGAQERWALVTNDPTLTGWEYAQRMWIEEAFRDLKSYGWQVEEVQLPTPERMANLWIILVVAYGWMLLIGHTLEAAGLLSDRKRRPDSTYAPRWSVFREGRSWFLNASPPYRI